MEQEELLKFRHQLQRVEEEIKKERAVLSSQQQAQVERMVRLNPLPTAAVPPHRSARTHSVDRSDIGSEAHSALVIQAGLLV